MKGTRKLQADCFQILQPLYKLFLSGLGRNIEEMDRRPLFLTCKKAFLASSGRAPFRFWFTRSIVHRSMKLVPAVQVWLEHLWALDPFGPSPAVLVSQKTGFSAAAAKNGGRSARPGVQWCFRRSRYFDPEHFCQIRYFDLTGQAAVIQSVELLIGSPSSGPSSTQRRGSQPVGAKESPLLM